jgi:hypothetical protein
MMLAVSILFLLNIRVWIKSAAEQLFSHLDSMRNFTVSLS